MKKYKKSRKFFFLNSLYKAKNKPSKNTRIDFLFSICKMMSLLDLRGTKMVKVYFFLSYKLFLQPESTRVQKMLNVKNKKATPDFLHNEIGYSYVTKSNDTCEVLSIVGRVAKVEIKIKGIITQKEIKLSQKFASKISFLLSIDTSLDYSYSFVIIDGPIGFDIVNKDEEVPFIIRSSFGSIILKNNEISEIFKNQLPQLKLDKLELIFLRRYSQLNFHDALSWVTENYGSPKK